MQQENKMKFVLKSGFIKILLKSKENGLFTRIIFVFFLIPSGFCLEGYFKEQNIILQISGGILKQNKKNLKNQFLLGSFYLQFKFT